MPVASRRFLSVTGDLSDEKNHAADAAREAVAPPSPGKTVQASVLPESVQANAMGHGARLSDRPIHDAGARGDLGRANRKDPAPLIESVHRVAHRYIRQGDPEPPRHHEQRAEQQEGPADDDRPDGETAAAGCHKEVKTVEHETLMLIGGQRSGEQVSVAKGMPWVRVPRQEPFPLTIPKSVPSTVETRIDTYYRRTYWPFQRDFFVLAGMTDAEAEIELKRLQP